MQHIPFALACEKELSNINDIFQEVKDYFIVFNDYIQLLTALIKPFTGLFNILVTCFIWNNSTI